MLNKFLDEDTRSMLGRLGCVDGLTIVFAAAHTDVVSDDLVAAANAVLSAVGSHPWTAAYLYPPEETSEERRQSVRDVLDRLSRLDGLNGACVGTSRTMSVPRFDSRMASTEEMPSSG